MFFFLHDTCILIILMMVISPYPSACGRLFLSQQIIKGSLSCTVVSIPSKRGEPKADTGLPPGKTRFKKLLPHGWGGGFNFLTASSRLSELVRE